MTSVKRISANLPAELLKQATDVTGQGITETLVEGLRLVKRTSALHKAERLKGRLDLRVDLAVSRERARR
jgi:hypothetical protein